MEIKKKEFKSIAEIIKVVGNELDKWDLKLKKDEAYKLQSQENIADDRARHEMFMAIVLFVCKRLDKFTSAENLLIELETNLYENGEMVEAVKDIPLGMFFEMLDGRFRECITLVKEYRELEKADILKVVEAGKKKPRKQNDNANAENKKQGG